jgi:hypothetical protein
MNTRPPNATLLGIVEKIIESSHPSEPEKAQIAIEGTDGLDDVIRIENTLRCENGGELRLTPGAQVRITVKAQPPDTIAEH